MKPQCAFVDAPLGADLSVVLSGGSPPLSIEIKGTASPDLAWQKLKVSSKHSWDLLANQGIPVYRVCNVFERTPSIYILLHGRDFILEPEARWTFKRLPSAATQLHYGTHDTNSATMPVSKVGRSPSSKYDSLKDFLRKQTASEVTLRFTDAESILGFPLPSSAYSHQAYWANQSDTMNRPWARAWQEAGFEVDGYYLSREDGWVRFKRRDS
jgi:hypothetical protein